MESHRVEYYARIAAAQVAERDHRYDEAIEEAMHSWKHIKGMMQYERKYEEKTIAGIEGIDIVLRYAPLMFKFTALELLSELLKAERHIEKNTTADLAATLSNAWIVMEEARQLMDFLEQGKQLREAELETILGGSQKRLEWIAGHWVAIGVVERVSHENSCCLKPATSLGDQIRGKCPSCGVVGKAAKDKFLSEVACPKCHGVGLFVLLSENSD